MPIETKIVDMVDNSVDAENADQIKKELDSAIDAQKKVRRMIDLFIFGLFLVYIMYIFID